MNLHKNTRTTVSTNSGSPSKLPEILSISYPFLDVVFPSHPALAKSLVGFSQTYQKGRIELCKVLDTAYTSTDQYSLQSGLLALSLGSIDTEDVWCIDHRNVLTLSLTKQTYYRLGLVGERRSKKSNDRFVVHIDLYDRTSKLYSRAKDAFRKWDEQRSSQGFGPWEVLFHGSLLSSQTQTELTSNPHSKLYTNVYVPIVDSKQLVRPSSDDVNELKEEMEDWHERIAELFEWVGMSCIGSERLKANDRVNPYVAVYEPPSPNKVGNICLFRWRGFLVPDFIQTIIKTVIDSLSAELSDVTAPPEFVGLTANMFPNTPLSFISASAFADRVSSEVRNKRSSRSVHCWSVIAKPRASGTLDWVLAAAESTV